MVSSTRDLQFYDLSHPWGHGAPLWPYFPDVKIERFHYHAKSGVLSQQITTFMHTTTHTDALAHAIEGTPYMDEVPLERFFGTAVVVSIPKGKWEKIMPEDLEWAEPRIQPDDIVIINTGWHKYYGDNRAYFAYSPGLYREAGEWLAKKKVKAVGAKVMLTGRNEDVLEALVDEVTQAGGKAAYTVGRPDDAHDVRRIVTATIEYFGRIDILITAAGLNHVHPITDFPLEEWEKVMDVNVKGTWLACKEVGCAMIKRGQGGKVILVSSTRGELGMSNYSAYSPSKGAIHLLTRSLACEWGQYGINVNAIAPTVFRTALTQWMFDDQAFYKRFLTRIPLGHLGEPEDLVGPLIYFASHASDFMTGTILYVDGGYTAG